MGVPDNEKAGHFEEWCTCDMDKNLARIFTNIFKCFRKSDFSRAERMEGFVLGFPTSC